MKAVTTIQVTSDEDREIVLLKQQLRLPSKKAVVLEGLRTLRQTLQNQERRRRLQKASRLVGEGSRGINEEWAPLSSALRTK